MEDYIQPTFTLPQTTTVYAMDIDENGEVIFREEETSLIDVPHRVSTKYFDLPSAGTLKNPYSKGTQEYEQFVDWSKDFLWK